MKRIILFVATNLAVVLVLSIVLKLFGLDQVMAAQGFQYGQLLVYSMVVGFAGAIISLLMSKTIAKWTTGAQVIASPRNEAEAWLMETVRRLATGAGVAMPEVAIYEGAPNAFATGAFKNSALVAVSTGLLQSMNKEEVEAVLGHELSHVANGDMVTLTLIQGVVNTFVDFPVAHRRIDRRPHGVSHRARHRTRLFHHRHRLPDRVRHPGEPDRRVVLTLARVPRRCRQRTACSARSRW